MNRILRLFFLILSGVLSSQNSFDLEERKGAVFFKLASQYRFTPIFGPQEPSRAGLAIELNEQNTGAALNYAIDWFVIKNLSLGFSHSLRYDHILEGNIDTFGSDDIVTADRNGILMDFHLYAQYHLKVFKRSELFVQLGGSLLNVGSAFQIGGGALEDNGEITFVSFPEQNANFYAANIGLGWKKKRIAIMGGVYTSSDTVYFTGDSRGLTVPYFQFSYNIGAIKF